MLAAVYYNNHDVRIEEMPTPEIGEEEVLLKVMASGICGSDVIEWYRVPKAPRVLGHEATGVISKVGSKVKSLKVGDRVFVSHHVPCNQCRLWAVFAFQAKDARGVRAPRGPRTRCHTGSAGPNAGAPAPTATSISRCSHRRRGELEGPHSGQDDKGRGPGAVRHPTGSSAVGGSRDIHLLPRQDFRLALAHDRTGRDAYHSLRHEWNPQGLRVSIFGEIGATRAG